MIVKNNKYQKEWHKSTKNYREERAMGSDVVKRVRNQLLAYRFVCMA
jgi:hypothetical protein